MALLQLPIQIYTHLGQFFAVLWLICIILISIYHIKTSITHHLKQSSCLTPTKSTLSLYISFLSLFIAVLTQCNLLLAAFNPIPTYSYCDLLTIMLPSLYSIWKLLIYYVLSLRVYESFANSFLKHNPKILIFYAFVFTFWSAFNIFYGITTNEINDYENIQRCFIVTDNFLIISTVLLDGTAGIIYT